jgi:CDP-paratose 2-epimerase
MKYLITGGAGFVGSSLAIRMKGNYPKSQVICLDNLKRRGSELNLPRLRKQGVDFIHGDIRNKEDFSGIGAVDVIIECSAEPSVLAGYNSSSDYLVNTNLFGTVNCLEFARACKASFVMLSTSRVYPFKTINSLDFCETETRFELEDDQKTPGSSSAGFTEDFTLTGVRSLYGATKLASELLILEYADMYGLNVVINRCGVLTGSWQFGKVDQGVVVLWVAKHFWNQELSYIGFGGQGKQVRDILHVDDLFRLIDIQLNNIEKLNGDIFNVGGGREISVSLKELTNLCQKYTGNAIPIRSVAENRPADIRIYLTDNSKVTKATGWKPEIGVENIIKEIAVWIKNNENYLEGVLK